MARPAALIVTDGKIGDLVQCRGVAEAMGLDPREFTIRPRWPWSKLSPGLAPFAPHWTVDPADRLGLVKGPLPDIAITSGHRAAAAAFALKRASGGRTFTILLKDARAGTGIADFIWVPEHDPLRGPNVMTTLTSPHGLFEARMTAERAALPSDIAVLPAPRVTVLLGGPSGRNRFSDDNVALLAERLRALAAEAGSFLLTPSRRTPSAFANAIRDTLDGTGLPLRFWDGTGDNPYLPWMAAAHALVVTGDSVNMVGEAAAMGRAVMVHRPDGLSPKIARFLDRMEASGATVPFTGSLPAGPFAPTDATPHIAAEALRRYEAHVAALTAAALT